MANGNSMSEFNSQVRPSLSPCNPLLLPTLSCIHNSQKPQHLSGQVGEGATQPILKLKIPCPRNHLIPHSRYIGMIGHLREHLREEKRNQTCSCFLKFFPSVYISLERREALNLNALDVIISTIIRPCTYLPIYITYITFMTKQILFFSQKVTSNIQRLDKLLTQENKEKISYEVYLQG